MHSTHSRIVDFSYFLHYNGDMEEKKGDNFKPNEEAPDLAVVIGKNITRLRKMLNMTQSELAEKLNYSDKSVSKWEQGNGIPDVRILLQIAELFNVSLDDLVREHPEGRMTTKKDRKVRRIIVTVCSVGLCWLVAVACFVLIGVIASAVNRSITGGWLSFVYAVPASAIVVLVFSAVWRWKWTRVISLSVLIWTLIACVYLTVRICGGISEIWLLFLLGVPLELLTLIFFLWKKRAPKN